MAKQDWPAIRADYLATGASYASLAKKWNVPLSTVKKRAMREKWSASFAEIVKATVPEMEPKVEPELEPEAELEPEPQEEPFTELMQPEQYATELRANRYKKMIETTDAMLDRVIDALNVVQPDNTYALLTLVKALKDIREMQGLNRSALDVEEQQLRIEKLKRETRAEADEDEYGVIILPEREVLTPPEESNA